MKKLTLIFTFALFINSIYAQQKDLSQLTDEFDTLLSKQFKASDPGVVVLVAKKGNVIYNKGFGKANLELNVPMGADNSFKIASITKQFTAVAILQLMEQGKLNLRDAITKYIPDYPTPGNKITIENLLTHTSGIINYSSISDTTNRGIVDYTPAEMINTFKNLPLRFQPGTSWEYSNSGYYILGYIIEKITGKSYGNYLEENFFKPLGMKNSVYTADRRIIKNRVPGYTVGPSGLENAGHFSITVPYAAGGIQSTVGDLFKWNQAFIGNKLLKNETVIMALTRYKLLDGNETAYGYGYRLGFVYEFPSIWHGGLINGYSSMSLYLPGEDVFVAVFANCDCISPAIISSRLAALAVGKPFQYKEIPIQQTNLQIYTGVYENQKGLQLIINSADNKLYAQYGRGPKQNLKSYNDDKFFINSIETIEFSKNSKKRIEGLITYNLAGNEVWKKTSKPIPSENGIKLEEKIIEKYVGTYQVTPDFLFVVSKVQNKLYLQAGGQEKYEMFADTETKFFLKVNDAQIEFIKDNSQTVSKAILNQGGRQAVAKKIQ